MSMRNPAWCFLLAGAFALTHIAAPLHAAAPEEEAATLLAKLPSQRNFTSARRLVLEPTLTASDEDRRMARVLVDKVKEVIPALRPLIREGASVFAYPGLLAHGDIHYSEATKDYHMVLGIYLSQEQGTAPYDFQIRFNAKGEILKVEDVIHKQ